MIDELAVVFSFFCPLHSWNCSRIPATPTVRNCFGLRCQNTPITGHQMHEAHLVLVHGELLLSPPPGRKAHLNTTR